jgi:nitroreductase
MLNETIRTILSRRSVRKYKPDPIEKDKLDLILQCALFAPSARNRQPWHFTVVLDRRLLDQISAANREILLASTDEAMRQRALEPGFDTFRGSPMAILVSGEESAPYALADCANAVENMALAAESLGLSSCYNGSFKLALEGPSGAPLLRLLQIPAGYKPLLALSLGYGDETLGERAPRRQDTVTYIE